MTDAQAALARYTELVVDGAEPDSPVERLRAFCSLAMSGQDWLDVEPFFDAILAHVEAQKAENERLTAERDELRRQLAEAAESIARQAATIRGLTRPAEE